MRRLLLATTTFALLAPIAWAAPVSQLAIDHVYVNGSDHVVALRATDEAGLAVPDLEREFEITVDGKGVGAIRVKSPFDAGPRTVTVVVDGALLQPSSDARPFVEGVLAALANQLAPGDRVRVVSAGPKVSMLEWNAATLKASPGEARRLAQDGGAKLFDALAEGAHAAADSRTASSALLLVITRGADQSSRARVDDVLARCTVGEGVTSVAVALLEDGGDAKAADKLDRLAGVTHGMLRRTPAMGGAAQDFVTAALGLSRRYELRFRPLEYDRGEDRHAVEVRLAGGGAGPQASQAYRLSEVSDTPWWKSLWVWVIVLVALAVAAAVLLLSRRRPIGLLVVSGGDDDGTWFEMFDLPLTIGSALQNDVLLVGEGISRNHCVLEREGREVVLVDTNSEKGTFVNDERIRRRALADEDRIRIGDELELVYEARR
ncbi:MAG: FHA domain-containing protein [Candidatus Eisenbacteria bacterium]|uniref:FHA domain-containing protein n=1 Tax=Eiseniibacteriota bacterium TaxID=2212470 RepID=A0A933S9U7_UNCEI|nr:FHA domain-containing protein [Candidatus Eisenbacteria bacterium]